MNFDSEKLRTALQSMPHSDAVIVGLSGGVDSIVLLHALHSLKQQGKVHFSFSALHVNHGLHAEAEVWKGFCEKFCNELDVPLVISKVHIEIAEPANATGLENAARDARYRAFESRMQSGKALLLAHHLDDQLETFLLRLMRGSGTRGLAGIPQYRLLGDSFLFRPLLDFTRESLIAYARTQKLNWIEDNSNQDTRFDRNYCRHELFPRIEQRWVKYRESWSKSLVLLGEADQLLQELAIIDLNFAATERTDVIKIDKLLQLSDVRRRNALRHWFSRLGLKEIGWNRLQQLSREVLTAKASRIVTLPLDDCLLQRFKGKLYALRVLEGFDKKQTLSWSVEKQSKLELGDNGILRAESVSGSGIRVAKNSNLRVKYRMGGEICQLVGRPRKPLKKLLQEEEVAPWLRERLPLLYMEDELVCIPGIGIAENYVAKANENGFLICWETPGFNLAGD